MSTLKGKTALVTGSTSGIGLGMAIALAKQGVNIMVNGFGEIDEAIAKIKACGVEVDYHGADMSKPAEIEDLIKQTEKRFGSLDILVNNAGITKDNLFSKGEIVCYKVPNRSKSFESNNNLCVASFF